MYSVQNTSKRSGLPHSEIHGSKGVGASPWLIAACYVLHRLSMPRHPSYALRHLIFKTCRKKILIFIKIDILIFYYQLICWLHIYNLQKQTSYKIRKNFMVGRGRFELPTSRLSSARSNQLSYRPVANFGGGDLDRTDDLLLAKQALSQLSYTPKLTRLLS